MYRPAASALFMRSFYALFVAEVGADRPFLKALQVGDTKCQNCLLPLFLCLKKKCQKKCALFFALFLAFLVLFLPKKSSF